MNDTLYHLPTGAAEFKAPRDFHPPVEMVELDFDKIKHEVADYSGKGFENVEKVENLTLVEYLQRLKADRGRYLGNIVHQGVRDHRGMDDHVVGLGEYDRELELIIKSGSLISSVGKVLKNEQKIAQIADEIRMKVIAGVPLEAAVDDCLYTKYQAGADTLQGVSDALAVHASTNFIIDAHYGAETGNESFIIFPEKVVLKDKVFFGRAVDTSKSRTTQHNDVYLWPQKEVPNELKINGAILFLPRDNKVDKNTGSTYDVVNEKAVIDTEKIDDHDADLVAAKENILTRAQPEDADVLKKILLKILETKRYSEISFAFQAFFDPSVFKPEFLQGFKDKIKEIGFDPDELDKLFIRNNNLQLVGDFFQRHSNHYNNLASSNHGLFYKRPEHTVLSKDYYNRFICERLKDVKVVSVSAGKQDIVEYRGINDAGEEEVIRVVFYSDHDPNQAIEGFYNDLSIDFDQTILGQDGVGSVDYGDVSYRYEYNKLRHRLVELVNSSS